MNIDQTQLAMLNMLIGPMLADADIPAMIDAVADDYANAVSGQAHANLRTEFFAITFRAPGNDLSTQTMTLYPSEALTALCWAAVALMGLDIEPENMRTVLARDLMLGGR